MKNNIKDMQEGNDDRIKFEREIEGMSVADQG